MLTVGEEKTLTPAEVKEANELISSIWSDVTRLNGIFADARKRFAAPPAKPASAAVTLPDGRVLTSAMVTRVYSGKAGKCCCGCSGKYSSSPAQVKRVLNLLASAEKREFDASYVAADIDQRTYIAYMD